MKLVDQLADSERDWLERSDTGENATVILDQLARIKPDVVTPDVVRSLLMLLKNDTDSVGRKAAAYALFGLSLGDSNQRQYLYDEMEKMNLSVKPHWRMAASRTLEMIILSDLIVEARKHPDRLDDIILRLKYLADLGTSSLYDDGHLGFAAQTVVLKIESIEDNIGR